MKNKGCLAVFVVCLAVVGSLIVVIERVQSGLHPVYHGKRLVEWADEAIWAEDPTVRQRAVEILREACSHEGEEARLRVYKELAIATREGEHKDQLSEELVPFLLEALKKEDQCAGMVTAALEKCPASQTVPQLVALLKDESDPIKRYYLIRTLGRFGPVARAAIPLLQQFLRDESRQLREAARTAMEQIDPSEAKS